MAQRLDNLPRSEDSYWEGAETNLHELPNSKECKHHFVRLKGNEIECTKCRIGFFVNPGDVLRDGHLYKENKLVI